VSVSQKEVGWRVECNAGSKAVARCQVHAEPCLVAAGTPANSAHVGRISLAQFRMDDVRARTQAPKPEWESRGCPEHEPRVVNNRQTPFSQLLSCYWLTWFFAYQHATHYDVLPLGTIDKPSALDRLTCLDCHSPQSTRHSHTCTRRRNGHCHA
jgi:hypothetical protein